MKFYCSKKKATRSAISQIVPPELAASDSSFNSSENCSSEEGYEERKEFSRALRANLSVYGDSSSRLLSFKSHNHIDKENVNPRMNFGGSNYFSKYRDDMVFEDFSESKSTGRVKYIENHSALNAPNVLKETNSQLFDWSENEMLCVALQNDGESVTRNSSGNTIKCSNTIYMHNPLTNESDVLCKMFSDPVSGFGSQCQAPTVLSLKWMPSGVNIIAVGLSSGKKEYIEIWDTEKKAMVRRLHGHSADVTSLDWNGKMLTSGGKDMKIIHHDISVKDNIISEFNTNSMEVQDLDWDLTGRYLAAGCKGILNSGSSLNIWDIRSISARKTTNPEEEYPIDKLSSFYEKSRYGFNKVKWSPNDSNILVAPTGTNMNFYSPLSETKIPIYQSSKHHFSKRYITSMIWDKQGESLKTQITSNLAYFYFSI